MKVVISNCKNGFSISRRCARYMADLGSLHARAMLRPEYMLSDGNENSWYGYLGYNYPRHCPILVKAVEALGPRASCTTVSALSIVTLKGRRYIINEHNGVESVTEPGDINWITIPSEISDSTNNEIHAIELKI